MEPLVRILPLTPEFRAVAETWAQRLGLALGEDGDYALQCGPDGLQLVSRAPDAPGAVRVDFVAGAAAHRRKYGGGRGQMIARAVGLQPGVHPAVFDATAGLGRDAFVLASLGCTLWLAERQPLIAALLEDGLRRAAEDPEVGTIVARMQLLAGDAIARMQAWSGEPPQVIYLDPMFPHREKSALVKKEMRLFRPFAGDDADAPRLLQAALALATHRVVVKRPRHGPAVGGVAPGYALEGSSSRYDIYPLKSLKPKG